MISVEDEIRQEGKIEGAEQNSVEIALNLLSLGKISIEEIATVTGLSIDKIRELANQKAV